MTAVVTERLQRCPATVGFVTVIVTATRERVWYRVQRWTLYLLGRTTKSGPESKSKLSLWSMSVAADVNINADLDTNE